MKMKKILAVGVILLFVGVAVAPTINHSVVKASISDDFVEVTTQACGIKGYGNTTVKLTREQYQDLEEYLVEFRARLNQTSTREEAAPLFKDVVVELDKYGLLPKGMSVERAQRLVTKSYNQRLKIGDTEVFDSDANYFCLVYGRATNTGIVGPFVNLASVYLNDFYWVLTAKLMKSYFWFEDHNLTFLYKILRILIMPLSGIAYISFGIWMLGMVFHLFVPLGILSLLTFGSYNYVNADYYAPSSGWVDSFGLNGVKKYEGSELWGTVRNKYVNLYFFHAYPGALDFIGFKINPLNENPFFLGSALKVKLGTEFPG